MIGQSILDFIMSDRYDPVYNQNYSAMNVMNNPEIASRCKVKTALKSVYAIKANAKLNNDMVLTLRGGFQNGYINLLTDENTAEDIVAKMKGYNKLSENIKTRLLMPYVQSTLLINELINLSYDNSSSGIKVKEKSGMRKDKFSSIEYGYWFIQELGKNLKPTKMDTNDLKRYVSVHAPKRSRRY